MTIQYKTLSEQLYADSDYLTKLANQPKMREYCQEIINATVDINRAAFNLAHPEEKTGKWIMPQQDDGMSEPIYYQVRCSKCNFDLDPQTWNQELHQYNADKYCPNCGARMVSE